LNPSNLWKYTGLLGRSLVAITLQVTVVLLLVSGVLYLVGSNFKKDVFEEAQRQGEFLFSTMSYQISDSLYLNNIEQIRKDSEFLTAQQRIQRIAVFSETGRYLFDSGQEKVPGGFIGSEYLSLAKNTDGILNRWNAQHIEFVGAIRFDGQVMGGLFFELDITEELEVAQQSFFDLLLVAGVLLIMVLGLGFAVVKTIGTTRSLRAVESNYKELIEQSPLPFSIFSADGQIKYVNPALKKLMGNSPGTGAILESGYNVFSDPVLRANDIQTLFEQGFNSGPIEIPTFAYDEFYDANKNIKANEGISILW